ncbi:hypothetical protein B8V81_3159 [Paenibacillus pasadenensis]|uniref:Uncharacterized protein n=1 Tax=Paenibacillus pasadenensis TaxID=217090 RepID=A0A2N5N319_9BACL|nr:hypothetical protein B8V81_3159 [Paenibacillus pasadenensis]
MIRSAIAATPKQRQKRGGSEQLLGFLPFLRCRLRSRAATAFQTMLPWTAAGG